MIFTQLCDDSRKPPISVSKPLVDSKNLAAVFARVSLLSSLPPSPLPLPPRPWLRRWSRMQLASQKGQQTFGHRESGSCQGKLSQGCPSSRAVWVSWQRQRWRDSQRESERGRTSVPTTVISHQAAQNVDLRSGGKQSLYSCIILCKQRATVCLQKQLVAA